MASDSISAPAQDAILPTSVHVLTIEHKHGENVSVHRTAAGAQEKLHGYVIEWWEHEISDEPMPEDAEEAIKAYFDQVDHEFNSIVESQLED
jgi:hypothetical protein